MLKSKGWVNELSASRSSGDIDNGFDFIRVVLVLSESGLENYLSVIRTVNAYMSLFLDERGLPTYLHDELRTISETNFRFSEKTPAEGYVTGLSETLPKPYAKEDILSGGALVYGEWSKEAEKGVQTLVKDYLRPEQARVTLMLRDGWDTVKVNDNELLWPRGEDKAGWENEKWYGTEYVVKRTALEAGTAVEGLHFPKPNDFIPTKFDVEKKEVTEVGFLFAYFELFRRLTSR